ncbi:MAG: ATP-binding protein [Rhodocyclaceae bacterium]
MRVQDTADTDSTRPAERDDLRRLRAERDAAVQAAQFAVRDTTRLTRLLTILGDPAPLDRLLDRVLCALSELFCADIVILLDPIGSGSFAPLAAIGLPEEDLLQPLCTNPEGYVAEVMRSKAPVLAADVANDPRVAPQLRTQGVETAVWLPVVGGGEPRGALILARCRPEPFAYADVGLLTAMAYRIGLALEQAQRSRQLEAVVRAGREIGRDLDETSIAAASVRAFLGLVGAEAVVLVRPNAHGALECAAQLGVDRSWDGVWCGLAASVPSRRHAGADEPFHTADLSVVAADLGLVVPRDLPVRALLAVPIRHDDSSQGLLFALRFAATPFAADTMRVAQLYAGQVSAALENARLYRAMREELAERVRAEQMVWALNETLEQRVQERTAALEKSNRELESFSYSVSHDLRSPLRALDGYSFLLEEEFGDLLGEHGRGYLQRIRSASQRMGSLIDDLIGLARVSRLEPARVAVEATALAARIREQLRTQAPERNVAWTIAPGIRADADPFLLDVVLDNLLDNAWKFTAARADARIEFGAFDLDGTQVLYVRDNGVGFDMRFVDKLFRPFQRLHTATEFPGNGIGLASVQRAVQRHGGRAWAEGVVGKGATVYFTLGPDSWGHIPQAHDAAAGSARPHSLTG